MLPQIEPIYHGTEIASFGIFLNGLLDTVVKTDRIGPRKALTIAIAVTAKRDIGGLRVFVRHREGAPNPKWLRRVGEKYQCAKFDREAMLMRFHSSTRLRAYWPGGKGWSLSSPKSTSAAVAA